MFLGTILDSMRRMFRQQARYITGNAWFACSGNFSLEQSLASAPEFKGEMYSNDVGIYTIALGHYLAGNDWRLEVKDENMGWLAEYLTDPLHKAAAVMLLTDLANFHKLNNPFQERMWTAMIRRWPDLMAKTMVRLEERKPSVPIKRFTTMDMGELSQLVPPGDTYIASIPTYKGGYSRLYKFLDDVLDYDRPSFCEWTLQEWADFFAENLKGPSFVFSEEEVPGREAFCLASRGRTKHVWLYGYNLPRLDSYTAKRKVLWTPQRYRLLEEDHVLTPESKLTLHSVDYKTVNYYRAQWLAKGIATSDGAYNYLVALDGQVFGLIILAGFSSIPSADADSIYLLSDCAKPSQNWKRLAKLVAMAVQSTEFKQMCEERMLRISNTAMTTAFTEKPVSMKYRGAGTWELIKRGTAENGEHFLNYQAELGRATLAEILAEWWKKHEAPARRKAERKNEEVPA